MKKTTRQLEAINLVGMEFCDQGRSLQFEIIDSIPPHTLQLVTFKNVVCVKLFQAGGDEYPLIIVDLNWREVPEQEKESVLIANEFPILDASGRPRILKTPLVAAHIEGDLVGDVLAEEVNISTP